MRCNSCGARTDADRSFCRRCGSAVFVEENAYAAQRLTLASTLVDAAAVQAPSGQATPVQAPPALPGVPLAADTAVRATRRALATARRARAASPPTVAASSGCLAALIRWAVFLGFIYYMLNATGLLPDVLRMAGQAVNGEVVDTRPIVNKVRAIVDLPPLEDAPAETEPAR